MEDDKFSKLKRLMDKGKWHYTFVHGVLGWGVSTAILFSLLQGFFGYVDFFDVLPLSLILFPIGGLFWGLYMWSYLGNQYAKAVNERSAASS
ncbi:hypothetical protein NQT69_17580 [Pseudoalteromonas shioyasakiensis]|uniref:hypothetical protein n=1 Tax=Pseudoalteromonas shioyasakiensis TaxID=1190813 RepID=UPI0021194254|nr:hypothetical protein [Pseudoalteromonas shioyasakiensis]MCQ8879811.1 hypothetical protein [Pseudoalteromonas shioyasakiensis]